MNRAMPSMHPSISDQQGESITRTKVNRAAERGAEPEERRLLIAKLGWAPEPPSAAERYCATTGELWQTVAVKFGIEAANAVRRLSCID